MPYVKRSTDGYVIAVSEQAMLGCEELVDASDPALVAFCGAQLGESAQPLLRSDLELILLIEDLVQLLLDKNTILFTELPEAARRKLLQREVLRQEHRPALELLERESDTL